MQLIAKDRWKKNHIILQLNLHSEYFPTHPPLNHHQNANRKIAFLLLCFYSSCVCLFLFGGEEGQGGGFLSEVTLNDRKQQQATTATCVMDTDIPKLHAQTRHLPFYIDQLL